MQMTGALALGDPGGIGLELAVQLLAEHAAETPLLVLGDAQALARGEAQAGRTLDLPKREPADIGAERLQESCFVDIGGLDAEAALVGEATTAGGASALRNFRAALRAAAAGLADFAMFTPFNKQAMRLAEPDYVDEIGFIARTLQTSARGSEFNVLDEVWNARVTSHIPLSQVAGALSEERVFAAIGLTIDTMAAAGFERPRIGVAALNPHAGDGRNFGDEDEDVIAPAVARAQARQLAVTGPVPSDTVFVRALKGEFDAVLTMYHDQGQIAMKLIGFDRGVTLIGGYGFPIVTPAHGTAYDIAGQGVANTGATVRALELGSKLAARGGRREPAMTLAEALAEAPPAIQKDRATVPHA